MKNKKKYQQQDMSLPTLVFNLTSIVQFTTLLPFILLTGAYFYVALYYGHFEIAVENYFVISDYLSVSVQIIRSSLLYGIYAVVATYSYFNYKSRKIQIESGKIESGILETGIGWFEKFSKIYMIFIYFLLAFTYFLYFSPYVTILIIIFTIPYIKLIAHIVDKYFNEPFKAFFMLLFIGFFLLFILTSAFNKIQNVYENIHDDKCLDITFSEEFENEIDSCEYAMIGTNTNYVFLINKNKENDAILILQKEMVVSFGKYFEKRYSNYPKVMFNLREYLLSLKLFQVRS